MPRLHASWVCFVFFFVKNWSLALESSRLVGKFECRWFRSSFKDFASNLVIFLPKKLSNSSIYTVRNEGSTPFTTFSYLGSDFELYSRWSKSMQDIDFRLTLIKSVLHEVLHLVWRWKLNKLDLQELELNSTLWLTLSYYRINSNTVCTFQVNIIKNSQYPLKLSTDSKMTVRRPSNTLNT